MVARVRSRQSDQRVVVFLSGKGGVGTTTVATGVGSVLAALRDDVTTLVSLRAGAPSLGRMLTGEPAPERPGDRPDGRRGRTASAAQRAAGRRRPPVEHAGPSQRRSPTWSTVSAQTSDFCLFDVGNDASEAAQSILAGPTRSSS